MASPAPPLSRYGVLTLGVAVTEIDEEAADDAFTATASVLALRGRRVSVPSTASSSVVSTRADVARERAAAHSRAAHDDPTCDSEKEEDSCRVDGGVGIQEVVVGGNAVNRADANCRRSRDADVASPPSLPL